MTRPFKGVVNIDIKDSVPDWEPYTQPIAPEGAPNVVYVVLDEVDLDTLSAELLAVVDQTMQPTRVSLWLRPSAHGSSGIPRSEARSTPWAY
jgi:hypothetical protein